VNDEQAANALDSTAVLKIFSTKARPSFDPLIVHVASAERAREYAAEFPPIAEALAARFWPGPLTLLLEKRPIVPDEVFGLLFWGVVVA
jgi:L-threonylcarbamoyladenylate synthase